ncbi:MAG TPA: radical SAM protein [Kofleriaceae bacterium]|nr:radical SAM protein [Kofleriaceae bacterium]
MLALQAVTDVELGERAAIDPAHARKLIADVHRGRAPVSRPGLPAAAIEAALAIGAIPTLEIIAREASAIDPFCKYALRAADGEILETVRIPLERAGRITVCVSSQVGCALACDFCATGRLGLRRNLAAWEIVEQVRLVARELPDDLTLHGVVFQGMGEALANFDAVATAIEVLTAPYAMALDARAITVSTVGLPEGIRRLARAAPKVRLALSIGSARPEVRASIMPITRAHPLDTILEAAADHVAATGLAPMWAVTLLEGVNDSDADADALAELAREFGARTGKAPRLSLIDYNPIGDPDGEPYTRSPRMNAFRDRLAAAGVTSHRRYSGGGDIAAACGQLAATRPA